MGGNVLEITDQNFAKETQGSDKPVLIDFWASWCGPCRMIAPVLDEIAKEFAGKIKVGKLNVDENSDIPTQLGIMNIPTLVIFKDGEEIDRMVGVMSKKELQDKINRALNE